MFEIRHIDRSRSEAYEQLGSKPKFWYREDDRRFLFKAEERGTGEDWAEKVACHLCELLGLPHVHYEMAAEYVDGSYVRPGVICETFTPGDRELMLGNQLLLAVDPNYPVSDKKKYKVCQHTVAAIADVLIRIDEPSTEWMDQVPGGVHSALDVFVGYVMLDAWIANQDRHHENWAAVLDRDLWLAPTFDHASSMARNISDEERRERMQTKDKNRSVAAFARKARSAIFAQETDSRPLGTVEAFAAFNERSSVAGRLWLDRLKSIKSGRIAAIFAEVPNNRMTSITKDFTLQLLETNRTRLLTEIDA